MFHCFIVRKNHNNEAIEQCNHFNEIVSSCPDGIETYMTINNHPNHCKQVLIVDDDEAVLESMKLILEDEGYCVETAVDGSHMYKSITNSLPQLIILDYRLPEKSGTLLAKELKKNDGTKHIPIVMVSSHDVAPLAKEAGASDFFEKPFDIETLLDVVGKHLSS